MNIKTTSKNVIAELYDVEPVFCVWLRMIVLAYVWKEVKFSHEWVLS